ncbi:caspase family protein [Candidatus Parcubacteria bacterium]|nr:caspase family protein [Candidatus Parcubacteria bacterium]
MKKILSLAIIFCCVLAVPVVAAMKSNPANDNANQNNKSDLFRPIHATDIKIAKKEIPSLDIIKEMKSRTETPPGQDKKKKPSVEENAATGILGDALNENANKYAVIIGICDYPVADAYLCWADGDSLNMYQALINSGYNSDNIYMYRDTVPNHPEITDGPATFINIKNAVFDIRDNRGLKEADEVVFFFSGHGGSINDISGDEADGKDEALVVHDGNNITGISDDMLKDWFSNFATSRIIFIFDTCLAGGMNDLADEDPSDNGRVVVMATAEDKSAYVYSRGIVGVEEGEGVFSHFFVNEGILQGWADKYYEDGNHYGQVVIEEAFDYAKQNIPTRLKRRQTPVISDMFTNDLLLGYYLPVS